MATKAPKPQLNIINPDTLQSQVNECITDYCDRFHINLYDYKERSNIKHLEVDNILRHCYKTIFKPNHGLMNNQKSLLDYDNTEQLQAAADAFIDICMLFNKALGLWSFCKFTGIDDNTVLRWYSDQGKKLNPARWEIIKAIKDYNTGAVVDSLKDTTVGLISVANNDIDTGLEWSRNNALQVASNTVFLLSSERAEKLRLTAPETVENVAK